MKILYVHNDYARPSGEEAAAASLAALLTGHGHQVEFFRRSSAELHGLSGQVKGFLAGIHNPWAVKALSRKLDAFQPDLVQVQNLYPLLSPAIFRPLRERGLPVVMRCPNYRLFCPNGLCYTPAGNVCEKCFGRREWHCVLNRCAGGIGRSLGYALRNAHARRSRMILDTVHMFIVQTGFQKAKFVAQGIPEDKIGIVPGIMPEIDAPGDWQPGKNITFVGRVSPEKGILQFLDCARALPQLPFVVAGDCDGMPELPENSPPNVTWKGFLKGADLRRAYLDSRLIVIPSQWYEGFPNVIVMGMMLARPIITSSLGATGTIIADDQTGKLCQPGQSEALIGCIAKLYDDLPECRRLGENARQQAEQLYSRENIYQTLMDIYQKAQRRSRHGAACSCQE